MDFLPKNAKQDRSSGWLKTQFVTIVMHLKAVMSLR